MPRTVGSCGASLPQLGSKLSYAVAKRDATGRRRGRPNPYRPPGRVGRNCPGGEKLDGRPPHALVSARSARVELRSTWDLWPLAAETAKEPTSRRVGISSGRARRTFFCTTCKRQAAVPSDRTCGFFCCLRKPRRVRLAAEPETHHEYHGNDQTIAGSGARQAVVIVDRGPSRRSSRRSASTPARPGRSRATRSPIRSSARRPTRSPTRSR